MSNLSDSGSEDVGMTYDGPGSRKMMNGSGGSGSQYDDDVCRDYMRNVCTRGKNCRYRHPTAEQAEQHNHNHSHNADASPPKRDITFCHDYQNNGCTRGNCKYLHCTRDEQEWFHRTGLLPLRLNQPSNGGGGGGRGGGGGGGSASNNNNTNNNNHNNNNNNINNNRMDVPLCKDYLHGDCKRGGACRYRHKVDQGDFDRMGSRGDYENIMICKDYLNGECKRGGQCKYRHVADHDYVDRGGSFRDMNMKRRRLNDKNDYDRLDRSDLSYSYLEEENETLKRKVEELKKQVADLTAINEVLLEQNARYRVSKGTAMVPVSQQTLTAVAMAPSPVPATGVAQAPVHAAQGTLTLTTQQHALQTAQRMAAAAGGAISLAAQQPPPQMVAGPSMTPTVTLTQNIAGGPPMALTQSNMAVSMAQMPQPPQLQVAHSLTQNLGAPSTSLVSYPIMSQNMRSAVEHSSLAH